MAFKRVEVTRPVTETVQLGYLKCDACGSESHTLEPNTAITIEMERGSLQGWLVFTDFAGTPDILEPLDFKKNHLCPSCAKAVFKDA